MLWLLAGIRQAAGQGCLAVTSGHLVVVSGCLAVGDGHLMIASSHHLVLGGDKSERDLPQEHCGAQTAWVERPKEIESRQKIICRPTKDPPRRLLSNAWKAALGCSSTDA